LIQWLIVAVSDFLVLTGSVFGVQSLEARGFSFGILVVEGTSTNLELAASQPVSPASPTRDHVGNRLQRGLHLIGLR
jgi:hypothetical protein